jgi:hypothetical protein
MSPYQESQAYKYVKMPQTLTEVRRERLALQTPEDKVSVSTCLPNN